MHELLGLRAEELEVFETRAAPLWVSGAEGRRDDGVEQSDLALGRRAERTQVPRVEAEAGELATRCGDVRVEFAVEPLAAFGPRLQQTELLDGVELGDDSPGHFLPMALLLRREAFVT